MDVFRCAGCGRFARPEVEAPSVYGCQSCGAAVSEEGAPQRVSTTALDEAIRTAPVPLLVEFWAPDCEPCHSSAVVLDVVSHRLAGEAVVLRLDVEHEPEACDAHAVLAVPTVVLFSAGQERGRRVGPFQARALEEWVRATARTNAAGPVRPAPVCRA